MSQFLVLGSNSTINKKVNLWNIFNQYFNKFNQKWIDENFNQLFTKFLLNYFLLWFKIHSNNNLNQKPHQFKM